MNYKLNIGDVIKPIRFDASKICMIRNNDRTLEEIVRYLNDMTMANERSSGSFATIVDRSAEMLIISFYTAVYFPYDNYYVFGIPEDSMFAKTIRRDRNLRDCVHYNNDFYVYIYQDKKYVYLSHYSHYSNILLKEIRKQFLDKYDEIEVVDFISSVKNDNYYKTSFKDIERLTVKVNEDIYYNNAIQIDGGQPLYDISNYIKIMIVNNLIKPKSDCVWS